MNTTNVSRQVATADTCVAERHTTFDAPGFTTLAHRERAARSGPHSLTDAEALELLVSRNDPANAGRVAQALLTRFRTLHGVLAADDAALKLIVHPAIALDLKLTFDINRRIAHAEVVDREVLSSHSRVLEYVALTLGSRPREAVFCLFLDTKLHLIRDEIISEGTVDFAPINAREIIRRALELSASSLMICHNHPSGVANPSKSDITLTAKVVEAASVFDIKVLDHLIVGDGPVVSFRALGLM